MQRHPYHDGISSYSKMGNDFGCKPGEQHTMYTRTNANLLGHLPLPDSPTNVPTPGETILLMEALQSFPVTTDQIGQWTTRDSTLAKVKDLILHGWRDTTDNSVTLYQLHKYEFSVT